MRKKDIWLCFLLGLVTVYFTAFSVHAQTPAVIPISAESETTVNAPNCTVTNGNTTNETTAIFLTPGQYAEYKISVSAASVYQLALSYKTLDTVAAKGVELYVDDVLMDLKLLVHARYAVLTMPFKGLELTAGEHTIRIQVHAQESAAYTLRLYNLIFKNVRYGVNSTAKTTIPSNSFIDTNFNGSDINRASNYITFRKGYWIDYSLDIQQDGVYQVIVSAGAPSPIKFEVWEGANKLCGASTTATSAYNDYKPHSIGSFQLTAGQKTIRLLDTEGAGYCDSLTIKKIGSITEPTQITATDSVKIEAENYNLSGGDAVITATTSGQSVILDSNQWISFDLNVVKNGIYKLSACYAKDTLENSTLNFFASNTSIGEMTLASTDGSNTYQIASKEDLVLNAGTYQLKIALQGAKIYLDSFHLELVSLYARELTDKNQIEAENCDESPLSNTISSGSGTVVPLTSGNGLHFSVKANDSSVYKVKINAMAVSTQAIVKLVLNDVVLAQKTITNTEYATMTLENVRFKKGTNVLQVVTTEGELYFDYFTADLLTIPEVSTNLITVDTLKYKQTNIPPAHIYTDYKSSSQYNKVGCFSFQPTYWATYDVNIAQTGIYELKVYTASLAPIAFTVYGGDTELLKAATTATSSYNDCQPQLLGNVSLEQGIQTLKLLNRSGGGHFFYFTLELVGGGLETYGVYVNDIPVANDTIVPRGYDYLKIYFNQTVSEVSVNENTVVLSKDNQVVPTQMIYGGSTVTLIFKNTLQYNSQYRLSLNGITDRAGSSKITNELYSFETDGTDGGSSTISLSGIAVNYEQITLEGVVLTSLNTGIAGRKVVVSLKTPSGTMGSAQIIMSGADGKFNLTYTLASGSECGVYTVLVDGEYVTETQSIEFIYVSAALEQEILGKFKATTNANEVELLFKNYERLLGLNLLDDMQSIPDKSKVYEYFVGGQYASVTALKKKYHIAILMEICNQAADASTWETILSSEQNCNYLGIVKGKADLVIHNKANLLSDLLALPVIKQLDAFTSSVSVVIEKWLMKEYGKQNVTSCAQDQSVYIGQGIELDIGFTTQESNVRKLTYVLECEDDQIFEDSKVELNAKGNVTMASADGKLTIEIVSDSVFAPSAIFGKVILTAYDNVTQHQIKISGKVHYDVKLAYLVESNILPKTIAASVSEKKERTGGSVSSSADGGTGRGKTTTPINPGKPDTIAEPSYQFIDLDTAEWASEAIYGLLNKRILTQSEDKTFRPNQDITREEFVKMVVVLLGVNDSSAQASFSDVKSGEWYYSYIASAEKYGIVTGDETGNFHIGKKITREEMAVILYRTALKLGYQWESNDIEQFTDDKEVGDYAKNAVYIMKSKKIINGVGDNRFAPKANATRAMAAKMIFEMIKAVGL